MVLAEVYDEIMISSVLRRVTARRRRSGKLSVSSCCLFSPSGRRVLRVVVRGGPLLRGLVSTLNLRLVSTRRVARSA